MSISFFALRISFAEIEGDICATALRDPLYNNHVACEKGKIRENGSNEFILVLYYDLL